MSETPPFWLNEDGDYWTPADLPAEEGAALVMDTECLDEIWLIGRTTEMLRDCAIDHFCDDFDGACHCDTHENEPCPNPPEQDRDVWHFSAEAVEGATRYRVDDLYKTAEEWAALRLATPTTEGDSDER